MVYNGSAIENQSTLFLSDCLDIGRPIHNLTWDVLFQTRLNPVVICGDIRQAFL